MTEKYFICCYDISFVLNLYRESDQITRATGANLSFLTKEKFKFTFIFIKFKIIRKKDR